MENNEALIEDTNALVHRALSAAGYRADGFRIVTIDRLCAWTSVYCESLDALFRLRDVLARRFEYAMVEMRTNRIDIIW